IDVGPVKRFRGQSNVSAGVRPMQDRNRKLSSLHRDLECLMNPEDSPGPWRPVTRPHMPRRTMTALEPGGQRNAGKITPAAWPRWHRKRTKALRILGEKRWPP